jgi:hypothetical protein
MAEELDPLVVIRNLQDQLMRMEECLNALPITAAPAAPAAPDPALPHFVHLKPDRPPPFSGKKGESLEAWIFQMEQYCELLPVLVPSRVPFAATFLKENAALWYRAYSRDFVWHGVHANPPPWHDFTAALRQQFIPVNVSTNAYDRLRRLTQRTSVNQYSHEFRAIMLDLPDMDAATRMHFYVQGLKEHIRPLVAVQQPANVTAAEAIAERVDSVTYRPNFAQAPRFPARPQAQHRTPYQPPGGVAPMDIDAIGKLTDQERERLRREGACFRCRRPGHMSRECPLKNRRPPNIAALDETPSESGKEDSP